LKTVSKINCSRVLGCGPLAGIVWIILGSVVTALLGRDFAALPNNHLGMPTAGFVMFNVLLDLLEGISILWLYAAIRSLYSPGAKTAVIRRSHGGLSSAWATPPGVLSASSRRAPSSR
jgi:hypothetical protein